MLGADVANTVANGSLLLAVPIAAAAGVVSFLSPCVLPLVPGYLSYVTGLSGADLAEPNAELVPTPSPSPAWSPARHISRPDSHAGDMERADADEKEARAHHYPTVLLGSILFVLGFSAVFVAVGAFVGGIGGFFLEHEEGITKILGLFTIALGILFIGRLPWLWTQREFRIHKRPTLGVIGAFPIGVLFGLGWTPCIGPTLAAVESLAFTQGTVARGAFLSFVYCLGLGIPFVIAGLAFRRALGAFGWVRKHYAWVMGLGGGMLVILGLLMVTGAWTTLSIHLRVWVSSFSPAL